MGAILGCVFAAMLALIFIDLVLGLRPQAGAENDFDFDFEENDTLLEPDEGTSKLSVMRRRFCAAPTDRDLSFDEIVAEIDAEYEFGSRIVPSPTMPISSMMPPINHKLLTKAELDAGPKQSYTC